jgi:hypothetical protein
MNSVNFLNLEYIYLRIFDFFKNLDPIALLNALIRWIGLLLPFSLIVSAILVYIIIYAYTRHKKALEEEDATFKAHAVKDHGTPKGDPELHAKWAKVQAHVNSQNPSDWRLAILEADILLYDVLEKMGFQGDSIGEKLKSVKKEDFLALDQAWEAHKIRNEIAHKGSDFALNDREARRVVDLYKKVFDEFYIL